MALFPINAAITLARNRKVLPSDMSSAEMRDAISKDVRARSVFSARTTSVKYLEKQRQVIGDYLAGKLDKSQARTRLKLSLAALGYDPEKGFPGNKTVPPAFGGTLEALNSDRRLNLILETQWGLIFGAARRQREGEPERLALFPAWELVRTAERITPRGYRRGKDNALEVAPGESWEERWVEAGGTLVNGRMIAWKWDPIWTKLGSTRLFEDGLDSNFTPYWFDSGAGIVERSRAVSERLLGKMAILKGGPADNAIPAPQITVEKLPRKTVEKLKAELDAYEAENGKLTFESVSKRVAERYAKAEAERRKNRRPLPQPDFN